MGDVIQFPVSRSAELDSVEAALRDSLIEKGATGELLDFAMGRFQHHRKKLERTEQYQISLELPGSLGPDDISNIKVQIGGEIQKVAGEFTVQCYRFIADLVVSELLVHQY